ncbi:MAG: sulfatase-like hydrolase/transferase, partial [Flavobacteriales bacterium]|nr:sulfatase-like hydrolase/transferase [Flavobacteriales bacterium]
KEAFLFEDCIATSSWTLPTHASIFTGLPPAIHGTNGIGKWRIPTAFDTLAEVLHDENYTTVAFTDGGFVAGAKGFSQGFDLYSDGVSFQRPRPVGTAKMVVEQTINWLDTHQEAPFFLFMHTFEIHELYQPPSPFLGKFGPPEPAVISLTKRPNIKAESPSKENVHLTIARYDEGIAYTDYELKKLFDYLKENGLTENTLIVLFSDHGDEFYDHGGFSHSNSLYSEVLHVPLIIRLPGTTPLSGRVSRAVSQLDLFATVMEVLKIDYTPPSTSYSLLPLINQGIHEEEFKRTYATSQLLTRISVNQLPVNQSGLIGRMLLSIQDDRYKYILTTNADNSDFRLQEAWDNYGLARDTSFERQLSEADPSKQGITQELYFLTTDMMEQNNRADESPEIIEHMRQLLRESLDDAKKTASINATEKAEEAPLTDDERKTLEALGYL